MMWCGVSTVHSMSERLFNQIDNKPHTQMRIAEIHFFPWSLEQKRKPVHFGRENEMANKHDHTKLEIQMVRT